MPIDVNIDDLKPLKNFGDGPPGSGSLLALKILLQALDNIVIVNSTGTATPFINGVPSIHAGLNAISVATGVSRGMDKKANAKVVVFSGDGATAIHLASLLAAKDDLIYICVNNFGYNLIDYRLGRSFAREVSHTAAYTATACIAHLEDYIAKLKKAQSMGGLRFIEVLCPSPESWGFDPSNLMEVGRVAVETGLWPLYEVENGVVNLTKRPNRLEPVEGFNHVQKKLAIPANKIQSVQDTVSKNWKALTDGMVK